MRRLFSPVAVAIAHKELCDVLTEAEIKLLLADDGQDVSDVLADVSLPIGIVVETLMATEGRSHDTRMLHGAMRTIHSLCMDNNYRWDSAYAGSLGVAIDIAARRIRDALKAPNFTDAYQGSKGFGARIQAKCVERGDVKGVI